MLTFMFNVFTANNSFEQQTLTHRVLIMTHCSPIHKLPLKVTGGSIGPVFTLYPINTKICSIAQHYFQCLSNTEMCLHRTTCI